MALVTIDTVVDIAANIRVLEIGGIIPAVASRALEDGIVVRIDVARGAHVIRVAMRGRELCVLRVIERGAGPGRGAVAGLARGGEELLLRRVTRVGGVVVVGLMAADAGCRQRRVVVVDVAVRANTWRHHVRTGEWERRVVVIKRGVGPDDGVVAELTGSRESGRRVRGIVGASVILLMTGIAQGAV